MRGILERVCGCSGLAAAGPAGDKSDVGMGVEAKDRVGVCGESAGTTAGTSCGGSAGTAAGDCCGGSNGTTAGAGTNGTAGWGMMVEGADGHVAVSVDGGTLDALCTLGDGVIEDCGDT